MCIIGVIGLTIDSVIGFKPQATFGHVGFGGKGALIGGGGVPIGLGSDVGGSIRLPCAFNGICGHKPTGGLMVDNLHWPKPRKYIKQVCVYGPMARRMEDVIALMKILPKQGTLQEVTPVDTKKIKVYYYDVVGDLNARQEVQNLAARYQVRIPSFPCIQVAGQLVVGYQTDETTGKKIENFFVDRSVSSSVPEQKPPNQTPGGDSPDGDTTEADEESPKSISRAIGPNPRLSLVAHTLNTRKSFLFLSFAQDTNGAPQVGRPDKVITNATVPRQEVPELSEEVPLPDEFELPAEAEFPVDAGSDLIIVNSDSSSVDPENVEIPFFGRLSLSRLGLPTFTFLIGLVDGFNPCAMWVLVFLLSVLVNIKERKKILLVAGTFVVVSGLAYFTFMAAWFNVFQLIGLLRPVQIGLGIIAIIVGSINVKDFFAFHQGVTLSIPESAKPTIYRRVRQIVSAKHMTTALCAAVVLAIVVNIVELLCTAGLPALYTEVLTMQELPTWANYSYLALYISAYMLDDAILVGIVVVTLSHRRLQESEGRWLKLLSGVVILLLGAVMIVRPDLLV